MKRLLFIEKFIETTSILPYLSANNSDFAIDTVSSTYESVALIKKNQYDLIYININFLDMTIIPLFEILIKSQYSDNIIFSGDYKNPRVIKKTKDYKSLNILIKPFDGVWLRNTISDHLKHGSSIGNESSKILTLRFLFKLIDIENGTIAFKINIDGKKGLIIFEEGIIVHVRYDNKNDMDALKEFIKTDGSSGIKELKIFSPGLFLKKNSSIRFNSILPILDTNSKKEPPKVVTKTNAYSELISFMIEKMEELKIQNSFAIIESTANKMGVPIDPFPQNEEITLIENISKIIKNKENVMRFKKYMIDFLISKDKNC